MIKRKLLPILKKYATQFPVVSVLGPRQSGKTTLTKAAFPNYKYISLEETDNRYLAISDPRKFLSIHKNPHGIILDEIQNVPDLTSYIQTYVDENNNPGYFIITGSHNILLNQAISQTLAGRVAILTLLPLSINELQDAQLLAEYPEDTIWKGFYPRIFNENLDPEIWYKNYINTYIERDVRQIKNIGDISQFQYFIQLCAGRIGQLFKFSEIAKDCGISTKTARSWLSILEMSYIVFRLLPHHNNFSKRLIKSPKIYFYDTGLACSLLGIKNAEQLHSHYNVGSLFESLIISELFKHECNRDSRPHIYFWRDTQGNEMDCVIEKVGKLLPIEIKSGRTINPSFFDNLKYWAKHSKGESEKGILIYGGNEDQDRTIAQVLSWKSIDKINF